MIDYITYTRKFGYKDRKGQYHASIPESIFNLLKQEAKFAVGFKNEITFALMEDVLVSIASAIMTNDSKNELASYKRLANVIKKVLVEHKNDLDELGPRYYQMSPSPEERELFVNNPILLPDPVTKKKVNTTYRVSMSLVQLSKIYRALNTDVGNDVFKELSEEKDRVLGLIYDGKFKDKALVSYPNILNFQIDTWKRKVVEYELNANNLKLINKGIKNARRKH